MFTYEKEMIPVITEFFKDKLNQSLFVKELNTGIGIADIVFSHKINQRDYYFDDFELLYHTLHLLNKKNKKLTEIDFDSVFSKKQISSIIEKFIEMELINQYDSNIYYVKNKLAPSITEFYAIEAKLMDWKNGFYQALRYKNFAQKSFLALSSEYIHRPDIELFQQNNVGLISVSPSNTEIIFNPAKNQNIDEVAFYFMGDKFTKNIFLDNCQNTSPQIKDYRTFH